MQQESMLNEEGHELESAAGSTPSRGAAKRNAIVLEADIQEKVAVVARQYKVSQGQVVLTMLELLKDSPELDAALKAKREAKMSGRSGKTAMLKQLSKLSAEELEALLKSLQGHN